MNKKKKKKNRVKIASKTAKKCNTFFIVLYTNIKRIYFVTLYLSPICSHISSAICVTYWMLQHILGKSKISKMYWRVRWSFNLLCFYFYEIFNLFYLWNKNCSCEICINTIIKLLLEIHWLFFMKGIYIPPTRAIEEIRVDIQNVEMCQSNQVKIIKLGMFLSKLFFPKIWLVRKRERKIFWTTAYFLLW